jgi:hypothetical protein
MSSEQNASISINFVRLLLVLTFFLISFGQLQRIQLSFNVAFYLHDFLIGLIFFTLLIKTYFNQQRLWPSLVELKWVLIFLGWSLISLIINQFTSGFQLIPWLYWVRLLTYLGTGWLIATQAQLNSAFNRWARLAMWAALINFVLIGFAQYLLIPDLRFLADAGWDVHYFRLAGSMLDPNFLGMLLGMGLIFLLLKTNFHDQKKRILFTAIITLALALTYSRSSYLSFAVMMMVLIASPHKLKSKNVRTLAAALSILLLFLIPVLPRPGGLGVKLSRTETIDSRVHTNQTLIKSLNVKDWLIGRGLFTPTVNLAAADDQITHAHFPDNILVFILSGAGLPGLLLFIKFIWERLYTMYQKNLANFLLLLGILTHSFFNLSLLEPINLLILLLGLSL